MIICIVIDYLYSYPTARCELFKTSKKGINLTQNVF